MSMNIRKNYEMLKDSDWLVNDIGEFV